MGKTSRKSSGKTKLARKAALTAQDSVGSSDKVPVVHDVSQSITKSGRTREFICEQAAPLFNKRGFAGTSLIDLTEATGLTKGALYGNFRDKEGIAVAAFAYSMQQVRRVMKSRLDPLPSQKQKLIALLEFFREYVMHPPIPGGCPMMNYGVESDDSQRFLRKSVAREMQSTVGFIQQCLKMGVEDGEFKSTADVTAMAHVIFCSIEGAIVVSRVTGTPSPMAAVVTYCRTMLDEITSL